MMTVTMTQGDDIVLAATLEEAEQVVAERHPDARPMSVRQGDRAFRGLRIANCYVTRTAQDHPGGTKAVHLLSLIARMSGGTMHLEA